MQINASKQQSAVAQHLLHDDTLLMALAALCILGRACDLSKVECIFLFSGLTQLRMLLSHATAHAVVCKHLPAAIQ